MRDLTIWKKLLATTLLLAIMGVAWLYFFVVANLPSPEDFEEYFPVSSDYTPILLDEIPDTVCQATVVIEDRSFYSRALQ